MHAIWTNTSRPHALDCTHATIPLWSKMFSMSILAPSSSEEGSHKHTCACTNLHNVDTHVTVTTRRASRMWLRRISSLSVWQSIMRFDSLFIRTPHGRLRQHPLPLLLIWRRGCVSWLSSESSASYRLIEIMAMSCRTAPSHCFDTLSPPAEILSPTASFPPLSFHQLLLPPPSPLSWPLFIFPLKARLCSP